MELNIDFRCMLSFFADSRIILHHFIDVTPGATETTMIIDPDEGREDEFSLDFDKKYYIKIMRQNNFKHDI